MFHEMYEEMVRFASEGELGEELQRARAEYLERTGELFESDDAYERRIAAFLEWYVLDRPIGSGTYQTPAALYVEHMTPTLTESEVGRLEGLTRTTLSLFEFRGAKKDTLKVKNLLTNEKHNVFERRKPAGLESGDILEARIIPFDDKLLFSDSFAVHPREARKTILKAAKTFRKNGNDDGRIDLVHRVARLANKCVRYAHVDPKQIFAELE
jgi:hypothetical protein